MSIKGEASQARSHRMILERLDKLEPGEGASPGKARKVLKEVFRRGFNVGTGVHTGGEAEWGADHCWESAEKDWVDEALEALLATPQSVEVEPEVFCLGRLMVSQKEAEEYDDDFCDLYEASETASMCQGQCAYTEAVRKKKALSQPTDLERETKLIEEIRGHIGDDHLHTVRRYQAIEASVAHYDRMTDILTTRERADAEPVEVDWQFETDLDLLDGRGEGDPREDVLSKEAADKLFKPNQQGENDAEKI